MNIIEIKEKLINLGHEDLSHVLEYVLEHALGIVSNENTLIDFLRKNPYPSDAQVHEWAEENGLDIHIVEMEIYALATKWVEFISGGRSIEKDLTEDKVDSEQLQKGIDVEIEHTKDRDTARKIALDHLAEFPYYYEALEKMEKELDSRE